MHRTRAMKHSTSQRHFYESLGKVVIRMAHEAPGFIANHLQGALEREALHLVPEVSLRPGRSTPSSSTAWHRAGRRSVPAWSANWRLLTASVRTLSASI